MIARILAAILAAIALLSLLLYLAMRAPTPATPPPTPNDSSTEISSTPPLLNDPDSREPRPLPADEPETTPPSKSVESAVRITHYEIVSMDDIPVEAQFSLAASQLIVRFDDGDLCGLEVDLDTDDSTRIPGLGTHDSGTDLDPLGEHRQRLANLIALRKAYWRAEDQLLAQLVGSGDATIVDDPSHTAEVIQSKEAGVLRRIQLPGEPEPILVVAESADLDAPLRQLHGEYTRLRNELHHELGATRLNIQRFRPAIATSHLPEEFLRLLQQARQEENED